MFVKYLAANIAAGQTDAALVTAVASSPIVVLGLVLVAGATATTVVFNTKPSGSGSAISAVFALPISGSLVLPVSEIGWFTTLIGAGLTVTTGAGATTGIQIVYGINL